MRSSPLHRPAAARRHDSGFPEGGQALRCDRVLGALAEMAVTFARCGQLDAARPVADEALGLFGGAHDPSTIARASLDLGEALLLLGDPSCRALLEDAGTLFEDLGDQSAVLCVDALLRTAQARIEESPRSFQTRRPELV